MIILSANKNRLDVTVPEVITSGSINAYQCQFLFTPEWDDLSKTVTFKAGNVVKSVIPDEDGMCMIPWEVMVTDNVDLYVGVCGINGNNPDVRDDDVKLPTIWARIGKIMKGVYGGDSTTLPPTPSVYEQILIKFDNLNDSKQDKLKGEPGQIVGFDENGDPIAKDSDVYTIQAVSGVATLDDDPENADESVTDNVTGYQLVNTTTGEVMGDTIEVPQIDPDEVNDRIDAVENALETKQTLLVEGRNITLTENEDGTVTIAASGSTEDGESGAGSEYTVITATPAEGNIAAYRLRNVSTNEVVGVTINIPDQSYNDTEIKGKITELSDAVDQLKQSGDDAKDAINDIKTSLDGKQDKLTAGDNITIADGVISAVDQSYDDTAIKADIDDVKTSLGDKQDKLTAGDNITITDGVISAADQSYDDTAIKADIDDVKASLDGKQDKLTAGDNITITDGVISASVSGSGEGYDDTAIKADIDDIKTSLDDKQDKLTAGDNITIADGVISAADQSYDDTAIKADIDDVKASLDDKQDKLIGTEGQFVGFDANGNAVAVEGPVDGEDGVDGITPHIGENGNWFIGDDDTGISATPVDGVDGEDGLTPYIGENGNWFIGEDDTGVSASGTGSAGEALPEGGTPGQVLIKTEDGAEWSNPPAAILPHVGDNGNWFVGDSDTGVKASGTDGTDGADGVTPHIGDNGNWYLEDYDTGMPSRGEDGQTPYIGANGNWFIGEDDTGVSATGASGSYDDTAIKADIDDVKASLDDKQDKLTAGDNITIADGVISAADQSYDDTAIKADIDDVKTSLDDKQDTLTAGDNITITDGVISADTYDDTAIKADIDDIKTSLDDKQDKLTAGDNITIIDGVISASVSGSGESYDDTAIRADIDDIKGDVDDIKTSLDDKQDKLTAGDNITIADGVISAADQSYDDTAIKADIDDVKASLDGKQDKLTAGDNITIADGVISAADQSYDDTDIKSEIDDLKTTVEGKQDALTAGDNITITDGVISAANQSYDDTAIKADIEDIKTSLDDKQDTLTAGDNITITDGVISADMYDDTAIKADIDDIKTSLDDKQDKLTAGDNITITDGVISAADQSYDDTAIKADIADIKTKNTTQDTAIAANTDAIATLNGEGAGSVKKTVTDAIAEVVADAPEDFDTLKEMSDWISNHADDASAMNSAIQQNSTDITALQSDVAGKQDALTAGDNITIADGVISAADQSYDDTAIKADIDDIKASLDDKQDTLTAGDNITITGSTISADMYDDTAIKADIDDIKDKDNEQDDAIAANTAAISASTPKSFSVATSAWSASTNTSFPYKATITSTGLTAADLVNVYFDESTIDIAVASGAVTGNTSANTITLLAKSVPTGTLSGQYVVKKG